MTITESLIRISDWLNNGVCTKYKFKVPPEQDKPIGDSYEYEEVNPHAFPVFLPTKDKLPPDIKTNMPSITVQLDTGSDDTSKLSRDLTINLGFSVWNPGVHGLDIYYPKGKAPEEPEKYKSGYNGWMDCWNFVDAVLRDLESASSVNGLRITGNIAYGPYKSQDSIPDYYPYWFAYIQFTVQSDILRNVEEYQEFL